MAVAANEVDQLTLLQRDVNVLFDEVRRLRTENDVLREKNEKLKERLDQEEQDEKDELAFYIKSQRLARHMSYSEFARMIGIVSDVTIKKFEGGKGRLKNMQEVAAKIRSLKGANK